MAASKGPRFSLDIPVSGGGGGSGGGSDGDHIRNELLTPNARALRERSADGGVAFSVSTKNPLLNAVARDELFAVEQTLTASDYSVLEPPTTAQKLKAPVAMGTGVFVHEVSSCSGASAVMGMGTAALLGGPTVYGLTLTPLQRAEQPGTFTFARASHGTEFVCVQIRRPIQLTAVRVYETLNPGAVTAIQIHDGSRYRDLWRGPASEVQETERLFQPPLSFLPDFTSADFRIEFDTAAFKRSQFKGVDAIEFFGVQNTTVRGPPGPVLFDFWQQSPLLVAVRNGNAELVSRLLAAQADPARKTLFGFNALDWAVFHSRTNQGRPEDLMLRTPVAALAPKAAAFPGSAATVAAAHRRGGAGPSSAGGEADGAESVAGASIESDVARGVRGRHHEIVEMLLSSPEVRALYDSRLHWVPPSTAAPSELDQWLVDQDPSQLNWRQRSARDAAMLRGLMPGGGVAAAAAAAAAAEGAAAAGPADGSAAPRAPPPPPGPPAPPRMAAQNALGETMLHHAVSNRDVYTLRLLIAAGLVRTDVRNDAGQRAFDLAAGDADMLAAIKDLETPVATPAGATLATLVADKDVRLECVAAALYSRAESVESTDPRQTPLLTLAIRNRRTDVVALLLGANANPLEVDRFGNTPLFVACRTGLASVVRMILSLPWVVRNLSGTDRPNARAAAAAANNWANANGDTILHAAALAGHPGSLRILLAHDFGRKLLTRTNNQDRTPVDLCTERACAAAINEAVTEVSRVAGVPTSFEATVGEMSGRVCAVCTMPPMDGVTLAFDCECGACVCDGCFAHVVGSAVMLNELPRCCNIRCAQLIPMDVLAQHVPKSQLLTVLAISINERTAIEAVYKVKCQVCLRPNDMRPILAGDTPRFTCRHCMVSMCSVCNVIWPQVADPKTKDELARNELDARVHASCGGKFASLKMFTEFYAMLERVGLRACPVCGLAGLKDNACCHAHCNNSCPDYCYVCGRNASQLNSASPGHHATYSGPWPTDPSHCPMYLHHMALVDRRVAALGCGQPDCRPNGNCPNDSVCRVVRDNFVSSLLNTIRVRCYVLNFMLRVGKAAMLEMLERFGWRVTIELNYFNGHFDWAAADTPQWWSWEPEAVQPFFKARLRWFVLPGDLADFVRRTGPLSDQYPRGAGNAGGGGVA